VAARLSLLVPGLLGPLPAAARGWEALAAPSPALVAILARGRRGGGRAENYYALIDSLFERTPAAPLPAAALSLLGEHGQAEPGHWLRADPVHLRADRDRVVLFGGPRIQLDVAEATALVEECNRFLAQDGLSLHAPHPNRWYLRCEQPTRLDADPTVSLIGRYVDSHLPRGADARRWLSLLTELQMLLHGSGINLSREGRGQPSVNSVWLWGEGALPDTVRASWSRVFADEPVLRGLGRLGGAAVAAPPSQLGDIEPGDDTLVCLLGAHEALLLDDLERWRGALDQLERDWLTPALARLRRGELDQLELIAESGGWRLRRGDLRRFWRRLGPLVNYLEF